MRVFRIVPVFVLGLVAAGAFAQIGSSISIRGTMSVQEGGIAFAEGFVESTERGIVGSFGIKFDRGDLRSLRMTRFAGFAAPGDTAFFEGPAQAVIMRNGRPMLARGMATVMVDDLHDMPDFPDQFFISFTTRGGERFIRHGRMTSGGIVIYHP